MTCPQQNPFFLVVVGGSGAGIPPPPSLPLAAEDKRTRIKINGLVAMVTCSLLNPVH